MWRDLSNVTVPSGFAKGTINYGTEKIDAEIGDLKKLNLVYLTDSSGENGAFYILDGTSFKLYQNLTFTQKLYTLVYLTDPTLLPADYVPSKLELPGIGAATVYKKQRPFSTECSST